MQQTTKWQICGALNVMAVTVATGMGCSGSVKWSGFGATDGQGRRAVVMPDLTLMTQGDAEAELRKRGFLVAPELDPFACGSTLDDKRVVELGRVCAQMPAPGQQASTAIAVKLRVQQEDPWRGQYRAGRAWFLMPDFAGMAVDAAQAKLRELGHVGREVKIAYVVEAGCKASAVCRTSPEAWSRADSTSDKIFFVGQPAQAVQSAPIPKADPSAAPTVTTKPADIF